MTSTNEICLKIAFLLLVSTAFLLSFAAIRQGDTSKAFACGDVATSPRGAGAGWLPTLSSSRSYGWTSKARCSRGGRRLISTKNVRVFIATPLKIMARSHGVQKPTVSWLEASRNSLEAILSHSKLRKCLSGGEYDLGHQLDDAPGGYTQPWKCASGACSLSTAHTAHRSTC